MDIEQLAGTRLGNYEIESLLGRGGMGVVYRALQISLDHPVALKILPHGHQIVLSHPSLFRPDLETGQQRKSERRNLMKTLNTMIAIVCVSLLQCRSRGRAVDVCCRGAVCYMGD